jgi:hypothetical protein
LYGSIKTIATFSLVIFAVVTLVSLLRSDQ